MSNSIAANTHVLTNYRRIGIAGAHRVGKTTLMNKLAEKLPHLIAVPTHTRTFIELVDFDWKDEKNPDLVLAFQRLMAQYHVFFLKALQPYGFICDRTIYDVLAYSLYHDVKLGLSDNLIYGNIRREFAKHGFISGSVYDVVLFYRLPEGYDDDVGCFVDAVLSQLSLIHI